MLTKYTPGSVDSNVCVFLPSSNLSYVQMQCVPTNDGKYMKIQYPSSSFPLTWCGINVEYKMHERVVMMSVSKTIL